MTTEFDPRSGWFSLTGPDQDVVLTSRTRISRHLENYPFVSRLNKTQESEILNLVDDAMSPLPKPGFRTLDLGKLTLIQRRMLVERGLVEPQVALHLHKNYYFLGKDELSLQVLGNDHLRIIGFSGGKDLSTSWVQSKELEIHLSSRLNWAFHPSFGYLGPRIKSTGSAVKVSFLLHLPAIERFGLLGKVLQTTEDRGFYLNGFWGSESGSNGSLYILANRFSAGLTEEMIRETADTLCEQIMQFERSARITWKEHHPQELEDLIWRAYGLLKFAKTMDSVEAWDLLSRLRLGICLQYINDVHLCKTLPAFTLSLKAHLGALNREEDRAGELKDILFSKED